MADYGEERFPKTPDFTFENFYNGTKIKFRDNKFTETTQGVRQRCWASSGFLKIYTEEQTPPTVPIDDGYSLNMLLFADDQVIFSNTQDNLQWAVHKFLCVISVFNGKFMAFHGKEPVRSKTIIEDKPVH